MARLIKLEVAELPGVVAVGRELRYRMADIAQGNNQIAALWDACFQDGTFAALEARRDEVFDPAYVGLMTDWNTGDGTFAYLCGMLMKPGCRAPQGFAARELKPGRVGVGWIQGRDAADVCGAAHELTEQALREAGHGMDGMDWSMELYNCPRFTQPDGNGEIILDYYIPCR